MFSKINKKQYALFGVSLSSFMGAMDFAIVNTALPAIQQDLILSNGQLQWVMSIFSLVHCTLLVTMGRLADIIGHRLIFYIGVILFGLASLFAGLAPNAVCLILFRGLQGAAGAMIMPSVLALITHMTAPEERGKAIGVWSSITAVGLAIGPALGGILVDILDWHWVFLINLPIVFLCICICLITLDKNDERHTTQIDWLGFALLTITIACLVTAIVQGASWGWTAYITLSLFIISLITGAMFIAVEKCVNNPILDLNLFANKPFFASALSTFTNNFFSYTLFFLLPIYLHEILQISARDIGLILLSVSASLVIVSPFTGITSDKIGVRNAICLGLVLLILTAFLQACFNLFTSIIFIVITGITLGVGLAFATNPAATLVMISLPKQLIGVATGALWTIRNIGGALGLAIAGVAFREKNEITFNQGLQKLHELTVQQQDHLTRLADDNVRLEEAIVQLPSVVVIKIKLLLHMALIAGYRAAMGVLIVTGLIALFATFSLLKSKSR